MSYFPTSLLGRILATLWLTACLGVLLFAYVQQGIHDMPIAFFWFMAFLSAPIGSFFGALVGGGWSLLTDAIGSIYHPFLDLLPMWITFVVVGYFQWFVALPWVIIKILKKMTRN